MPITAHKQRNGPGISTWTALWARATTQKNAVHEYLKTHSEKGVRPIVHLLDKTYEKGVTIAKKAFKEMIGYRSNTVDATINKLMAIERIRLEQEAASLTKRLAEFENLYNLSSKLFLKKFRAGEMGDEADMFEWSAMYQMWLQAHDRLENLIAEPPFWTLDKIDVGQGATNGSSLTTPGLVYLG
jgi:hypothetical protein